MELQLKAVSADFLFFFNEFVFVLFFLSPAVELEVSSAGVALVCFLT